MTLSRSDRQTTFAATSLILAHSIPVLRGLETHLNQMSHQIMPNDTSTSSSTNSLLHYSSYFKVAICKPCGFAIQPSAITQHLKSKHKVYRADREQILREIATWSLRQPVEVIYPHETIPAVPLIEVLDGFSCSYQGCDFLSVASKTMRRHSVVEHGIACPESGLQPVRLQTLFRGSCVRYFRVSVGNVQFANASRNASVSEDGSSSSQFTSPRLDRSLKFALLASDDALEPRQYEDSHCALMSHYLTQTCHTLRHSGPEAYYTQLLPLLSERCKYLKYGMFAITAMHLAVVHEQSSSHDTHDYKQMAAFYLMESLPAYRAAVDAVDHGNVEYIIAYSNCLMIARCGNLRLTYVKTLDNAPTEISSELRKHDAWEDLLSYVKITWANTQAARSGLQRADPDQKLAWVLPQHYPRPSGAQIYTEPLNRLRSSFETCAPDLPGTADILHHCFDVLSDSYVAGFVPAPGRAFDGILTWTSGISRDYIGLLERRHPHALALLAYFCVLYRPLQSYWWLTDHGKIMLKAIMDVSPGLHNLIEWPWQQLYMTCT